MAKPKNKATRTYKCQGRLNRGTNAHAILEERRIEAGILYDAILGDLADNCPEETLSNNQAQLLTTKVARELGVQRGPLNNRCRIATGQNAVNSWNNHVKHDYGIPRQYDGKPLRTIETFAHSKRLEKPLVTFNQDSNPKLHYAATRTTRTTTPQSTSETRERTFT